MEEDINGENALVETNGGPEASSLSFGLNRKSLGAPAVGAAPGEGAAAAAAGGSAPALPQLQRQHSIRYH